MVGQNLHWLTDVSDVPEFCQAVIAAACQVVLAVWIEVQITNQLTMCTVNTVCLPGKIFNFIYYS